MINSTAKGTEIAALSTIINTNETTEIAKLTALEALLTSINTYASQASTPVTIAGTLSVNVANQQATQAVFAANLPLPTGASTEITLAALSAKLGVLGQKLAAGSAPVVIASDQPALPVTLAGVATDLSIQQLRADIQAPTPAGTYTIGNVGLINRFTIDVAASTTIVQTGFIDIPLGSGQSLAATIKVTAVSGTLPTLDLILQEAMDDDDTFQDIYHMERIIGIGTFRVPTMQMHGRRRWKYVIGGTTPSFTFGITVTRSMGVAPIIRRFFVYNHKTDVSGNNATGASASATPSFNIEGCKFITLAAKVKYNATTPGAVTGLIFQVSEDNLFFGTFGSNFSITSSTTPNTDTLSSANYTSYGAMTKFIRAITSSSAAGNTCDYVVIKASN